MDSDQDDEGEKKVTQHGDEDDEKERESIFIRLGRMGSGFFNPKTGDENDDEQNSSHENNEVQNNPPENGSYNEDEHERARRDEKGSGSENERGEEDDDDDDDDDIGLDFRASTHRMSVAMMKTQDHMEQLLKFVENSWSQYTPTSNFELFAYELDRYLSLNKALQNDKLLVDFVGTLKSLCESRHDKERAYRYLNMQIATLKSMHSAVKARCTLWENTGTVKLAGICSMAAYSETQRAFLNAYKRISKDHFKFIRGTNENNKGIPFVLAEHKESKTVFLAFRGTDSFSDLLKDAKIVMKPVENSTGHVHEGFWKTAVDMYEIYFESIVHYLIEYFANDNDGKKKKLIITGHSLGGAVSILFLVKLFTSGRFKAWEDSINCIAFGAPLVGDRAFSDYIVHKNWNKHILVVVHHDDIVPRLLLMKKEIIKAISNVGKSLHFWSTLAIDITSHVIKKAVCSSVYGTVWYSLRIAAGITTTADIFSGFTTSKYYPVGMFAFLLKDDDNNHRVFTSPSDVMLRLRGIESTSHAECVLDHKMVSGYATFLTIPIPHETELNDMPKQPKALVHDFRAKINNDRLSTKIRLESSNKKTTLSYKGFFKKTINISGSKLIVSEDCVTLKPPDLSEIKLSKSNESEQSKTVMMEATTSIYEHLLYASEMSGCPRPDKPDAKYCYLDRLQ